MTLGMTLQTCLAQEFDDYEIVVSDNSTTNATFELIHQLASPKIKYVRPPAPLAMTDNWNFAINQASGEFITVLGSDDGLLLHALPELDRLIRVLGVRMLRWDQVCYNWPDLPACGNIAPNDLLVPIKQMDHYIPIRRRESREMILAAASSRISYAELPMIYCTVIHHQLIEELQERTGTILKSECPDVYSGFAFAQLGDHYHSIDAPFSINASSAASNGYATIFLKEKSPIFEDFESLNLRANHVMHEWIPKLPVFSALVTNSFLRAKAALFPDDETLSFDRRHMIDCSLRELRASNEPEWGAALRAVRKCVQDDTDIKKWFEQKYGGTCHGDFQFEAPVRMRRYNQSHLLLDASEFGVSDVMGAAYLCENLLGFKRDGVNAHLYAGDSRKETGEMDLVSKNSGREEKILNQQYELEKKEAVIQSLVKAFGENQHKLQELKSKVEKMRTKEQELRQKIEKLKT
ncbi:hypothetical protein BH11VER1_BH11VER1_00430 [soil metagenome]